MKQDLKWFWIAALLLLSILVELLIIPGPYYRLDGWYVFLASFGLILIGKAVGFFLKRKDDYYDD